MPSSTVNLLGASGYAGAELLRLLAGHPQVGEIRPAARGRGGKPISSEWPHLPGELTFFEPDELPDADVTFVALPAGQAGAAVKSRWGRDRLTVDLSPDFRLGDAQLYHQWYGEHPCPDLLEASHYGLPELLGTPAGARLAANPGCYATAVLLALGPGARAGAFAGPVIVDAKSGISGAGRTPAAHSHLAEASEDVVAYAVGGHRHSAEVVEQLHHLSAEAPWPAPRDFTMVTHLLPMSRGLLADCYVRPAAGWDLDRLLECYRQAYAGSAFVRVIDAPPHAKATRGSNACLLHIAQQGDSLVLLAAIDNLGKGAAGQAVQNWNLMAGFEETCGLTAAGLYP